MQMNTLIRPTASVARVQRRDRPWLNAYVSAVLGPFAMPPLEDVRGAVAKLTDQYPRSRINWRLDPTGRFWQSDRTPESIVTERTWHPGVAIGETLDMIVRDTSLQSPLSLIRFDNHLGLKMSHGIGDGRIYAAILAAVAHTALTGEVPAWAAHPSGRFPLAAAACRTFGRHPSVIKAAMDDRYRKEYHSLTAPTRPWSASRCTIVTSIPRSGGDEIGAKIGANRLGVQICLTLRALRDVRIKVASDINIVVDLRRYLGWHFIDGNFLAGVPISVTPEMTPEQISATIKATIRSGRPLAGQVLSSLRTGGGGAVESSVDADGPVRATFSSLATPECDRLPRLPGHPLLAAASVEPAGPLGLTFLIVETADSTWINAAFHDNVIDAGRVEGAMKSLVADPAGLLCEQAGAS
jgi:hypothetical protein